MSTIQKRLIHAASASVNVCVREILNSLNFSSCCIVAERVRAQNVSCVYARARPCGYFIPNIATCHSISCVFELIVYGSVRAYREHRGVEQTLHIATEIVHRRRCCLLCVRMHKVHTRAHTQQQQQKQKLPVCQIGCVCVCDRILGVQTMAISNRWPICAETIVARI